jgi:hypothetical protein
VEGATKEDAVDGADLGPAVGGHGRQRQQPHPGQPLGDPGGVEPPLRGVDPQQVRAGGGVASVEQVLQRRQVRLGPVHGEA